MEVVYTQKKKKVILFFNCSHDKFLTPLLLIPLEKNPGAATGSQNNNSYLS